MRILSTMAVGLCLAAGSAPTQISAQILDTIRIEGSLGEGGFARYVPPVTNPIFNETPLITTEIRPIYFHQKIPGDFVTGGGNIDVVAAQVRIALTDRLGFLATTDGYAFTKFDNVLPSEEGFADLAVGLKYAAVYDPAMGEILTLGARYTVPTGNLDVGGAELSGNGAGSMHIFASGMKIFDAVQVQGNLGIQQSLDGNNSSFFYASGHLSYELFPGVYPLVEANAFIPYDGGDRLAGSNITGFDVADIGASDPRDTVTLAAGARFRPFDNMILGSAFEYNVNESPDHLFQWRLMFDAVIHF